MFDALDFIVFDSVYHSGGGGSSGGNGDDPSMFAKVMAAITIIAIIAFIIYGWCEAT